MDNLETAERVLGSKANGGFLSHNLGPKEADAIIAELTRLRALERAGKDLRDQFENAVAMLDEKGITILSSTTYIKAWDKAMGDKPCKNSQTERRRTT